MGLGARVRGLLGASAAHAHRAASVQCVRQMSTFKPEGQRVPGFPRSSFRGDGQSAAAKVPPIIPAPSTYLAPRAPASNVLSGPGAEIKRSEARPLRSSLQETWTAPQTYQVISDPSDFVDSDAHESMREYRILAPYDPSPSMSTPDSKCVFAAAQRARWMKTT